MGSPNKKTFGGLASVTTAWSARTDRVCLGSMTAAQKRHL
jgi:hypothetical protein